MENELDFIGTYTIDEIEEAVDKVKKHKLDKFSFIINTKSEKDFKNKDTMGHWIAVWCDTDLGEFCIYDCLGSNPKHVIDEIKKHFTKYFDKT